MNNTIRDLIAAAESAERALADIDQERMERAVSYPGKPRDPIF